MSFVWKITCPQYVKYINNRTVVIFGKKSNNELQYNYIDKLPVDKGLEWYLKNHSYTKVESVPIEEFRNGLIK